MIVYTRYADKVLFVKGNQSAGSGRSSLENLKDLDPERGPGLYLQSNLYYRGRMQEFSKGG